MTWLIGWQWIATEHFWCKRCSVLHRALVCWLRPCRQSASAYSQNLLSVVQFRGKNKHTEVTDFLSCQAIIWAPFFSHKRAIFTFSVSFELSLCPCELGINVSWLYMVIVYGFVRCRHTAEITPFTELHSPLSFSHQQKTETTTDNGNSKAINVIAFVSARGLFFSSMFALRTPLTCLLLCLGSRVRSQNCTPPKQHNRLTFKVFFKART